MAKTSDEMDVLFNGVRITVDDMKALNAIFVCIKQECLTPSLVKLSHSEHGIEIVRKRPEPPRAA